MGVQSNAGSALSLGRLGLALGNGHAYAAAGSILGVLLGTAVVITVGALLVVGLAGLGASDRKMSNAAE